MIWTFCDKHSYSCWGR